MNNWTTEHPIWMQNFLELPLGWHVMLYEGKPFSCWWVSTVALDPWHACISAPVVSCSSDTSLSGNTLGTLGSVFWWPPAPWMHCDRGLFGAEMPWGLTHRLATMLFEAEDWHVSGDLTFWFIWLPVSAVTRK